MDAGPGQGVPAPGPGAGQKAAPPAARAGPGNGARRPVGGSPPNLVGIALVATAGLVAVIVTFGIFLPAFGEVGRMATRDPATLPATITVCDRDWQRDPLARTLTAAEIYERTEADPIVVSVGLFPACPAEVAAPKGMATSVWVQVGEDAYVGYDLVGGP